MPAVVVYYVASSVDGFIAPADGSLDWLEPFSASGDDHGYASFYASVDALIVGSRTYEQMLSLGGWQHTDRPVTVMSSRPLSPAESNVTVSALTPREELDALMRKGYQRIWLMGGSALAGSFESAGLIDEYVISYVPCILGSGMPLLGSGVEARSLELVEHTAFSDGIVQCRYVPGG